MRITGIYGGLGTGKTLSLVILSLFYKKEGYKIYTNMTKSTFADYSIEGFFNLYLNPDNNDNTKRFLAVDEMQIYLNSRNSHSLQNRILTNLIFQSRKRNIDIGFTTQRIMNIDIRLRDLVNYYIFPQIIERDEKGIPKKLKWSILDENNKTSEKIILITPEILNVYNTSEIIEITNLNNDLKKLSDDQKKLFGI